MCWSLKNSNKKSSTNFREPYFTVYYHLQYQVHCNSQELSFKLLKWAPQERQDIQARFDMSNFFQQWILGMVKQTDS